MDALKYVCLYKFESQMETDPVMTAMEVHRCGKAYWGSTVVRDGFVSYTFATGKAIGLEEETIPASKQVRSSDDVPTSLTLLSVPIYVRSGILQITFEPMRPDYEKYRSLAEKSEQAAEEKAAESVDLNVLLEEDQVWGQVKNVGDVTEEALEATISPVTAVGHNSPILRKGTWVLCVPFPTVFRRRSENWMLLNGSCLKHRMRLKS